MNNSTVKILAIVILKSLPVLQCNQYGDTKPEHATMLKVKRLLDRVDRSSELEVIRFAA